MRIPDLYNDGKIVFSCEVFPPKPENSLDTVFNSIEKIGVLKPDFISVTYGAAGGTRERTEQIASEIRKRFSLESLMHLTSINSTRAEIDKILEEVKACGIENILALRGDIPEGSEKTRDTADFKYAYELVEHIAVRGGFSIGVAAYPESHPESPDMKTDIQRLKEKVDTGADFIISQLFFDNSYFYSFMERAQSAGIAIPVSAGIMPVFRAVLVEKMVTLCGATIPRSLRALIEKYGDKPDDMEKAGIDYASEQVSGLIQNGVPGIHLYMMNRANLALEISENTGLRTL